MTIKFTKLEVLSFDLDHLDVFWEIEDTNERLERWQFFILRSEAGAAGPFETEFGPLFGNELSFRDTERKALHNWRDVFYKLRAVNKDDPTNIVEVGPAWLEAPPDLISVEIRRRMELVNKEFAGRRCLVYPAITSGFRCGNCYDLGGRGRSIGRALNQNCPTCFDMTFVGGFGKPIISYIQIDPSKETVQRTDTTETSLQDTTLRLSAFPPLKPKDMIVERENIRWEVQGLVGTGKLRAVTHQEVSVHRIPFSDIRYDVPVDENALKEAGPAREFTRPMNLESAQSSFASPLTDLLDGLLGEE